MASEILSRIRRPFRYSFKNATLSIIAINAVVYFLFNFTNLIPVGEDYFSINVVGFVFHQCFWQPLTYMFMHGNIQHLFFNMLALWMFGGAMEQTWGPRRFLLFYAVCGIGAGAYMTEQDTRSSIPNSFFVSE